MIARLEHSAGRYFYDFYLVARCWVGVTVVLSAAGESWNVSQAFQPDGRLAASNAPYPFRLRFP